MSAVRDITDSSKYLLHLICFVAAALLSQALLDDNVLASPYETAGLAPGHKIFGDDATTRPQLSAADAARYRTIFDLQQTGDWAKADEAIRQLNDRILLGHVLLQRYLHPKYHSSYPELVAWLKRYADLPGAQRIHRLALVRRPKGEAAPPVPQPINLSDLADSDDIAPWDQAGPRPAKQRNPEDRRRVGSAQAEVLVPIRQDRPDLAEQALDHADVRSLLEPAEIDDLRRQIAFAFYLNGNYKRALTLADGAARRSPAEVPMADWVAGLAAWRLHDYAAAGRHFEALANSATASTWDVAAGAYWASRAALKTRHPDQVNRLLAMAARNPHTFYGLLATRQLGLSASFSWEMPPEQTRALRRLEQIPAVRRAIVLAEIGMQEMAGLEIRQLYIHAGDDMSVLLLRLAGRLNTAAAALRMGRHWQVAKGEHVDGALYPVPPWQPENGFTIDRALLYAFMRQESAFDIHAKSSAGATGLMQIMPQTASFMADDKDKHGGRDHPMTPESNIDLGQKYLNHLLQHDAVRGNLLMLAAAYNAGPGTLKRWQKEIKADGDPLLFVESMPIQETRNFVERVMTNFWIYSDRLGQDSPSLDVLAGGRWPYYVAQDDATFAVANYEQD